MNITINRNGQHFGPYTLEQAQAYVASGQLLLTDMAFVEGTTVWVQLRVVLGVPEPPELPPERDVGKLIGMGVVWALVIWFVMLILMGGVVGALNPMNAGQAGEAAGETWGPILLLVAGGISALMTTRGMLPGTRKNR